MDDRSVGILAFAISFLVVSWLTVGLRVYCRWVVIRAFWLDDILIVIHLLFYTLYLSFMLVAWKYGLGKHKHAANLTDSDWGAGLMWWFVCDVFYIICSCMVKLAVGFFLMRIAIHKSHVYILRGLMLLTVMYSVPYFILHFIQCRPLSVFWDEGPRVPGKCSNDTVLLAVNFTQGILNCLVYLALGILPLFILRSLNVSQKTKALIMFLVFYAAVGSLGAIFRMVYLPKLLQGQDFLYQAVDMTLWSAVGPGVGMSAVSLATLRPLYQYWRYKLGFSSHGPDMEIWVAQNSYARQRMSFFRSSKDDPHFHRLPRLRPDNVLCVTKVTVSGPSTETNTLSSQGTPNQDANQAGTGEVVCSRSGITITTEWSFSRRNAANEAGSVPEPDRVHLTSPDSTPIIDEDNDGTRSPRSSRLPSLFHKHRRSTISSKSTRHSQASTPETHDSQ